MTHAREISVLMSLVLWDLQQLRLLSSWYFCCDLKPELVGTVQIEQSINHQHWEITLKFFRPSSLLQSLLPTRACAGDFEWLMIWPAWGLSWSQWGWIIRNLACLVQVTDVSFNFWNKWKMTLPAAELSGIRGRVSGGSHHSRLYDNSSITRHESQSHCKTTGSKIHNQTSSREDLIKFYLGILLNTNTMKRK